MPRPKKNVGESTALPRRSRHELRHPRCNGVPVGPGSCEEWRATVRFGFNPKKSGPDQATPVIFLARAESER